MKSSRRLWTGAAAALWLAVAAGAQTPPYVVLQGNRVFEGVAIRARADGSVILTTAAGQQMEFPRDQIVRAVAAKPAEFDRAVRAVEAGQHDAAIPVLQRIVREHRFLGWDEQAIVPLARALLAAGNAAGAAQAFEAVLRDRPRLEESPEARWVYLGVLAEAGRTAVLEPKLTQLIREGPPADAARAQMLRGDLRAASDQFETALLDYLRTIFFYSGQRSILPEAYLRAAQTLEKMRDGRAQEWYKRLVDEFPASPEAAEARARM